MSFHMSTQISAFSESLATAFAFKGSLASVTTHVNLKSARPHETLRTQLTFERSLARVPSEVVRQMAMGGESSSTTRESAGKWFLTIVNALVRLQVALFCEALATAWKVALERFFSYVGSFVDLQIA